MYDKELYRQILGVTAPWEVTEVQLNLPEKEVQIYIEHSPTASCSCPECGAKCSGYDRRERRWRHLDTCQFKTIIIAQVPRVKCPEHGVKQVKVP